MRSRWWTSWTTPTSSSCTLPLSPAMTSSWSWSSKSVFPRLPPLTCRCNRVTSLLFLQCGGRRVVWPHHRWELQPDGAGHGALYTSDLWRASVHAQDVHPTSWPQGNTIFLVCYFCSCPCSHILPYCFCFFTHNPSVLLYFSQRIFCVSTELQIKLKSLTLAWPGGKTHHLVVLA